jgi:hypothetical protein
MSVNKIEKDGKTYSKTLPIKTNPTDANIG